MRTNKKTILRLGLISAVAIAIGAVVGLILNYQTIKTLRSEPVGSTPPAVEEEEKEKIATYSGTIKPSGKIYPEGTRRKDRRQTFGKDKTEGKAARLKRRTGWPNQQEEQ